MLRLVVVIGIIVAPFPFSENEVLFDENSRINAEPVGEEDEKGVEPGLKVVGSDDGEDDVDHCTE